MLKVHLDVTTEEVVMRLRASALTEARALDAVASDVVAQGELSEGG